MTLAEIKDFISSVGIPGALVAAICFAVWRWGWYLMTEVVKPLSVRAIAFFDNLETQVGTLVGFTTRIDVGMQGHGAKLDSHGQKLDEHGKKIDELLTSQRHNTKP